MPDNFESRPVSAPRKTLVEMFYAFRLADNLWLEDQDDAGRLADLETARGDFLARLREADALETALDEARICADADGVRIRELADDLAQERHAVAVLRADRDRETVNREAVQRVLAETVRERDALAGRYGRLRKVAQHVLDDVDLGQGVSLTTIARLGALLKGGT